MDEATTASEKRRRRPPLACIACRRRKVRCDRKLPCQNCVKARRTTSCAYAPDDRLEPRERSAPTSQGSNDGSSHVFGRGAASLSYLSPAATTSTTTSSTTAVASHRSNPQATSSSYQEASALAERVRQLEKQLAQVLDSKTSGTAGTKSAPGLHTNPPTSTTHSRSDEYWQSNDPAHETQYLTNDDGDGSSTRVMLAKSRYLGSSHWMHGITLFPRTNTLLHLLRSLKSERNTETHQAMAASKALARSIKASWLSHLMSWEFGQHVPRKELADKLLEAYFRTFETVYRILHVPSFRLEYDRYWQNPEEAREVFVIQLQLCMALGAVLHDEKYSLRHLAMRWIYEARLWLMQPPEKSRINTSGLQVWCLLHLAREVCGSGSDLVWVSAGTMMRMAMYTGLHRDPDHLPKMSLLEAETHRRLWATVLEILVQSSIESGGPPLISTNDYDTKAPGNYNDEDLLGDDVSTRLRSPQPMTTITDTSVQIALLSSLKARLQIASHLNEFRSVSSYDKTLAIHADLKEASKSLDALLRVYQSQQPELSSFQLCVVEHTIQRYFLALHLPWLGSAKNDPRYFFSRKLCVEIALHNQKEGRAHGFLGGDNGPAPNDFGHLLICGSAEYRYVGTQCLFVLTLELIWELEEQRNALSNLKATISPATGVATTPLAAAASTLQSAATRHGVGRLGLGVGGLFGSSQTTGRVSEMLDALRYATQWMRARLRAGEVNVKGYLFGRSMLAEAEGLQRGLADEELHPLVRQASTDAVVEALGILKEILAAEAVRTANKQSSDGTSSGEEGSIAMPRFPGAEGSQVPGLGQGAGDGFEAADTGSSGTDWDWDIVSLFVKEARTSGAVAVSGADPISLQLHDPNLNFNFNLNMGAMDLIFGNDF